jgi:hypothetical protein
MRHAAVDVAHQIADCRVLRACIRQALAKGMAEAVERLALAVDTDLAAMFGKPVSKRALGLRELGGTRKEKLFARRPLLLDEIHEAESDEVGVHGNETPARLRLQSLPLVGLGSDAEHAVDRLEIVDPEAHDLALTKAGKQA